MEPLEFDAVFRMGTCEEHVTGGSSMSAQLSQTEDGGGGIFLFYALNCSDWWDRRPDKVWKATEWVPVRLFAKPVKPCLLHGPVRASRIFSDLASGRLRDLRSILSIQMKYWNKERELFAKVGEK